MARHGFKAGRRAFTLVELLVVVGIITLLIALLVPALGAAREQARRAHCAANLRSIGQAMTIYVQHYGYYPCCQLVDYTKPGVSFAIWPTQLRVFMNGDQDAFYCPSQDERCVWPKIGAPPPAGHEGARADAYHTAFGYELDELLLQFQHHGYFSYGYNYAGWANSSMDPKGLGHSVYRAFPTDPWSWGRRASQVKVASEMIAVADSTADGVWDFAILPYPDAYSRHPGRVHKGGANVLFCDGHVQWYVQSDLILSPALTSPSDLAKRRMWIYDNEPHTGK